VVRPRSYVTDMAHLVELANPGAALPAPAKRLASYLGDIVSAASLFEAGIAWDSGLRCRRRPGHRPCQETIVFQRSAESREIHWWCPSGHEEGVIRNWEGTPWDLSRLREDDPREGALPH
jgi:hypothetical protein